MREDKFTMHEGEMQLLSNDTLICRDCIYCIDATAVCEKYKDCKPLAVLDGGHCERFKPIGE